MYLRLYKKLVYLFFVSGVAFLGIVTANAYESAVPARTALIENAEQSMQSAGEADADALAAVNFKSAADALDQARQAALKRKTKESDRFALKAIRYAELAANEARYIRLKEQLENKTAENSRLRRELLLGATADKP